MVVRIGNIEVISLSDGEGVFPFGFEGVFPDVPLAEIAPWRAVYPAAFAGETHPPARYGAFALRTPTATVLVDTGFGSETGPFPPGGLLLGALASNGIMAADVDVVVFSHLHPDHVGQTFAGDGEAMFEHARYVVGAADWRHFTDAARAADFPWIAGQVAPLAARELHLLPAGAELELVEGVVAIPAPGHTPGHTALVVRSRGAQALLLADAFFHPAQLAHPEWRNSADSDAAVAEATRRALLARVLDLDVVVGACHFPEPALGRVATVFGEPRWLPLA